MADRRDNGTKTTPPAEAEGVGSADRGNLALLLASFFILILLFYPLLKWLVNQWLTNDYYSHGPLVVLVSGFLAWRRKNRIHRAPGNNGIVLLGTGLLLYLGAFWQKAYYLSAFGMIIFLAGLVWFLLGRDALQTLAFPIAFLALMVPLPFVEDASFPLQQFTGRSASIIARAVGINVKVNGAQVTLPKAQLVVGAQCSGLRSVVSMITLATIFAYVLRGNWWCRAVLLASAIPVAILGNIFRVASLLIVADTWGARAGFHYYHNYSSPVFFLSALLLLLSLSWVMKCREIRNDI